MVFNVMKTQSLGTMAHGTIMGFSFLFQFCAVSISHVASGDITVTPEPLADTFTHRKANYSQLTLVLSYSQYPEAPSPIHIDILLRWARLCPSIPGFFNLSSGDCLGVAHFVRSMEAFQSSVGHVAAAGLFHSFRSARIGGFNEPLGLVFTD